MKIVNGVFLTNEIMIIFNLCLYIQMENFISVKAKQKKEVLN